jgi:hypothetical protein
MLDVGCCEIQVGGPRAKNRGVALVDAADAEVVGAYRWYMATNGYAMRTTRAASKHRTVYLHRFLLGLTPDDPRSVDHTNGNKLDNRRPNLRVCTHAQNQQNLHDRPYRGACWDAHNKRWKAYAQVGGKNNHLGHYATREEAVAVAAAFRRQHMPFSRDAREAA